MSLSARADRAGSTLVNGRLIGDAAWATTAMAVYVASQIILVTSLALMATPAEVGELIFAIAVTGPPFMFSNLQLRVVLATDVTQEHKLSTYRTMRTITALGTFIVICLISIGAFESREGKMMVIALALAKAIESLSDIRLGQLERDERIAVAARSTFMRGVLTVGSFLVCFSATGSLVAASVAIALAWLAILLLHDMRVTPAPALAVVPAAGSTANRPHTELMALFRKSLPLGLAALVLSAQLNFPRFWLGHSFGSYELGIFGLVFQIAIGAQMLGTAFSTPMLPRLSHLKDGDYGQVVAIRAVGLLAIVGAVAGIVATVILPPILNATVGGAYTADSSLLILTCALVSALLIRGGFVTVLRAQQRFNILFSGELFALLVQVCLTSAIGNRLGTSGPPFALLLALTCSCLLYLFLLVTWRVAGSRSASGGQCIDVRYSNAA